MSQMDASLIAQIVQKEVDTLLVATITGEVEKAVREALRDRRFQQKIKALAQSAIQISLKDLGNGLKQP